MVIYHGPYASKYTKGYNKKIVLSDIYYKFNKSYKNTPCIAKSNLAKEFLNSKGFKDVKTLGVGLDQTRFLEQPESKNVFVEETIKNKNENNFLLYIGKIEPRRNIAFLIDLLFELKDEKVKLILIGSGEKSYVDYIMEYAKNKKIIDKIIYKEKLQQTDIVDLYKNSELFLLPTNYEIFGMVLLEAMYFSLPCITSVNGGSSTIIENKKNGIIIPDFDIKKWAKEIRYMIHNESELTKMRQEAKKAIQNKFLWDKIAEDFIKLYNEEGVKCE